MNPRCIFNSNVLIFVVFSHLVKPLTVNLTQIDKKLSAGHKAEFECK